MPRKKDSSNQTKQKGSGACLGKEKDKSCADNESHYYFSSKEKASSKSISFVRQHVKYMNKLGPTHIQSVIDWNDTGGLFAVEWVEMHPTYAGVGKIQRDVLLNSLYPLLEAIYNAPRLSYDKTVFRGIHLESNLIPTVGTIFRHRLQPFSTTISEGISYMFAKTLQKVKETECILFEINANADVPGLYLDHHAKNASVSPHSGIEWVSNDEYELIMGYVDLVVREIKEDTRAETFLGKASKNYKPCHRVVCDVRPSDVYVLKIKQVYYIVVPSYCKEGLYEKLATQAELVAPLVINGVLQKLPDSL